MANLFGHFQFVVQSIVQFDRARYLDRNHRRLLLSIKLASREMTGM